MRLIRTKAEIRQYIHEQRCMVAAGGGTTTASTPSAICVALVPTLGALHAGHIALLRHAREVADVVVCSIYLNQTQFAPTEDFSRYPRQLKEDVDVLHSSGCCDCVFAPEDLYTSGTGVGGASISGSTNNNTSNETWVTVERLQRSLCGASRPLFFRGVATVVAKLFNIVQPDVAVFGRKDYQQYRVISRMVEELDFPIRIIGVVTVREKDGLAMSSRNSMLTDSARQRASVLRGALVTLASEVMKAHTRQQFADVIIATRDRIEDAGGTIDYLNVVDAHTLEDVTTCCHDSDRGAFVALVAATFDGVRLIDNIEFPDDSCGNYRK